MRSILIPLPLLLGFTGHLLAEERLYVADSRDSKIAVVDSTARRLVGEIAVSGAPQSVVASIDGRRLFVSSETKNAVDVVDRATSKLIRSVATGRRPGDVLLAPEGRKLFVAARGAGSIEVIDTATLEKTTAIFTGREPAGMTLTPDNTRIVAASAGDRKLSVINIRTESVEFEIPLGGVPEAVAFEWDKSLVIHRLFVLLAGDAGIDVIDWATRKSSGRLAGTVRGIATSPDRKTLWASINDSVVVYSLPDLKKAATVPTGKGASVIAFTPDGRRAVVACAADGAVSLIDAALYREIARIPVGAGPHGIAVVE